MRIINDFFRTMITFNLSISTLYYLKRNKEKVYSEAIAKENIDKDMFGLSKMKLSKFQKILSFLKLLLKIKVYRVC